MLKITSPQFEELTEDERKSVSNNGSGKEYASYIRVEHDGKTILLESDAMEPEDAVFFRDLSWIMDIIERAYEIGKIDVNRGGAVSRPL